MNNNIDFSDFHKIGVDRPSKCRKITKHRFEILSILTTIIVIILIVVYVNKNKQKNKKDEELSLLEQDITDINDNLTDITKNISNANDTINVLDSKLNQAPIYLHNNQTKLVEVNNTHNILNKTFTELLNQNKSLSTNLELVNKIIEKTKLKDLINERLDNLQIKDSKIITDVSEFEDEVSMKVKNKCFDSQVYGFTPEMFYKNCYGNALLFLIKTEYGEKIGAFTSKSKDENANVQDEKSMLINFDNNIFFKYNKESEIECNIIWNLNDFPKFGEDLIINNKYGESNFPKCYGINEELDFVEYSEFIIDILEIYKVKKN